jgi:hypothetical protein
MKTLGTIVHNSLLCCAAALALAGCGTDEPKSKAVPETIAKPEAPATPPEILAAAKSLMGNEAQVLAFGDLARTGKRQFLAANVVPKTPTNNIPGTIVTRAAVVEESGGKWSEVLICDGHLKNLKGYLGLTPIAAVNGWRLQFEQDPRKGLTLYFTPLQGNTAQHVLPIGVQWNPETRRYQSLDSTFQNYLIESPSLERGQSR